MKNTMQMKNRHKPQTPLQKLYADRAELRRLCHQEEQLISEHLEYIRENSGRLVFSGIRGLFFPRRRKGANPDAPKGNFWQNITDNLPFYLNSAREWFPVIWSIARPLYLKWMMSRQK